MFLIKVDLSQPFASPKFVQLGFVVSLIIKALQATF